MLELIRQAFCEHVRILPEAAGILFGGGFPRGDMPALRLCDRGTVDALAYSPGPEDFWSAVGTTLREQLQRYHAVIHLRTPRSESGYNQRNPLRIESAVEAPAIDEQILHSWDRHPRRFIVEEAPDFMAKAARALDTLRSELPECCRRHVVPAVDRYSESRTLSSLG